MTRLVQHISGFRRSGGRACKRCPGPVPAGIRQRLIDFLHGDQKNKAGQPSHTQRDVNPVARRSQPEEDVEAAAGPVGSALVSESRLVACPSAGAGGSGAQRTEAANRQRTLDDWKASLETEP